jgi:nicotinamidase-related amidase
VASKNRFSAFLPGHSDLPEKLGLRGIRNVVITGMLTNFGCETSARDAMMLDYRVVLVSDANAARYDETTMSASLRSIRASATCCPPTRCWTTSSSTSRLDRKLRSTRR